MTQYPEITSQSSPCFASSVPTISPYAARFTYTCIQVNQKRCVNIVIHHPINSWNVKVKPAVDNVTCIHITENYLEKSKFTANLRKMSTVDWHNIIIIKTPTMVMVSKFLDVHPQFLLH